MANPFSKGWKYLMASFDNAIDENADPRIQIQQATDAAKKQHQAIVDQASTVIGNQRQLEMKLDRLIKDQSTLQDQTREALRQSDAAAAAGDPAKATELTNTAEVLASQLVSVEQQIAETKQLHQQTSQVAEQAKAQVKQSEQRLTEQLSQIDQLRAQVDQAKMQEETAKATQSMNALTADDDVPTLDAVRDKIERRYANALGAQELTENSVAGRMAEISQAGSDFKASARLEEIRAQMHSDKQLGSTTNPALETGTDPDSAAAEK